MASLASLLGSARSGSAAPARRALRRRAGHGPSSRQLWLAVAVGSVALLLLAARRRRLRELASMQGRQGRSTRADARAAQPGTAELPGANRARAAQAGPSELGSADSLPSAGAVAEASVENCSAMPPTPPAPPAPLLGGTAGSSYVELPLPGVHRAAIAITLGRPAELRRLARDLQRAGQDSEAGLVENYALLLERVPDSRERVLAEVTRMLRAAAAERRSLRRTAPAIAWPPTAMPRPSAPAETATTAQGWKGVTILPQLTVGARRRAAR